jgi:hypothetical protein
MRVRSSDMPNPNSPRNTVLDSDIVLTDTTLRLAAAAGISEGMRVLDVGRWRWRRG